MIPFEVMSTRTSVSGYIQGFFTNFYLLGYVYYLPVYFQACRFASPVGSGVDIFGLGFTIMLFGLVAGISVAKSGKYRPQLWLAWVSLIIADGLLTSLDADSSRGKHPDDAAFFPVLAPLPVSLNANALAFFMFVRFFSQVWGVTAGGTILQNEVQKKPPEKFIQQFTSGTSVAYSIIPTIHTLDEPFRTSVRVTFADRLRVYWEALIAVGAAGLATGLFMKALPLHTSLDKDWGLKDESSTGQDGSRTELHDVGSA